MRKNAQILLLAKGGLDLREDIILQMVQPYVKDGAITYDEFEGLFDILSLKEQYAVTDVLYSNGINLIDKHIEISDLNLEAITEIENDSNDEFEILYDESLFKDVGFSETDENLTISKEIKQSNEALCNLIQQGNRQAIQDLCIKNKRLVDKYVFLYQKRYGNRLDFEDLEQVGYVGLIKAAQKYDSSQGTVFSTYAVFWIRQAITREIMDNGYAIRIPVHMMERINKVISIDNSLGREGLNLSERMKIVSDELGLSYEEVKECLIIKNNYLAYASINSPIGEEEESELGDLLPVDETEQTDEVAMQFFLREQLEEVLQTLTEREQKILILRFGLEDGRARTLEEVGQLFNVTRERIRQIEKKALRKMRHPSRSRKLKDYLD